MLEALVARWGYFATVAGTLLEGETVLLAGGAMAHRGLLSLPGVIACAFVASFAGDQIWFALGRRYGPRALERRPSWAPLAERVRGWLRRFGTAFVLSFRFLYGFRTITPVLLGASGYPAARFVPLNALGAAAWAGVFGAAGWGLGEGLARLLGRAGKVEEALLVALAAGVAIAIAVRHRARAAPH